MVCVCVCLCICLRDRRAFVYKSAYALLSLLLQVFLWVGFGLHATRSFCHVLCTVSLYIFIYCSVSQDQNDQNGWLAPVRASEPSQQKRDSAEVVRWEACVWTEEIVQNKECFVAACQRLHRSSSERALRVRQAARQAGGSGGWGHSQLTCWIIFFLHIELDTANPWTYIKGTYYSMNILYFSSRPTGKCLGLLNTTFITTPKRHIQDIQNVRSRVLNSPHHFLLHKVIQLFILFCSQKPVTIRGQIIPAEVASIVNSDDNNYNETNVLFPCRDCKKHFRKSTLFKGNHLNWLWQVKVNAPSCINGV